MVFKIVLNYLGELPGAIPVNYQYPLSAALYKVIAKGDAGYAQFLHEKGYGKGFKLFTFSQIDYKFKISDNRMLFSHKELSFQVSFHLPPAAENFVKGLFQSEKIEIADKRSKSCFAINSVESLPEPLRLYKDNEIVNIQLEVLSPLAAGLYNEKGNYSFLSPDDERFTESLIYNWRSKIETCYDSGASSTALLMMEVLPMKQPFKSRLITIKADSPQQTKIRGWINFRLRATAEKRFIELLLNAGAGVYNAMGFGCVRVVA